MSSLLDQSALTDLAERLVAAARRAGADAADALALRSVSLAVEVREGAVEESERSEGDDVGLRAFVGRRQAVVSTNDIKANAAELAERAVAMAKVAPDDPFAGLADREQLARGFPDLDLLDPDLPTIAELEERARHAETAALALKGVTTSGGASASADCKYRAISGSCPSSSAAILSLSRASTHRPCLSSATPSWNRCPASARCSSP